jgi:hypothetical protein
MPSNHGVRSDEPGATKGLPQLHGSTSSPPASHANRLMKYLQKNLTAQRSTRQKPPISTLANNGAAWRLLDGHDGLLMAPPRTTPGKRTPAKYVARPPPEPQPPPWPPPPRPWPPWPALNVPKAPKNPTLPAEVGSVCLLLPFKSHFSGAIRDNPSAILPTTIPPRMATNRTTKSKPTSVVQPIKIRPHHQPPPYVYPLPQLPPPDTIKNALAAIPPTTTTPSTTATNSTTRSCPTTMGLVPKTQTPQKSVLPFFYALPQLPPPLWIPPWPPPPTIQRNDRSNSHLCTTPADSSMRPIKEGKQQTSKNRYHPRHRKTKHMRDSSKTKDTSEMSEGRGKATNHGGTNRNKIRRFKVREPALQLPVAHLNTTEQTKTPMNPPERKIRRFKVREEQERPPQKRNYPKFLWRIGKLSKPEYTDYSNKLHALHQEYLRGKIDLDGLQYDKAVLMASIIDKFLDPATHNNRTKTPRTPTSPPIILKLAQPPRQSQHCSASKHGAFNKANNKKRRKRRRKEYRVVLRGSTIQQLRMTWWSSSQIRCKQLLDRKRPAVSVATGAAQLIKFTQRQLPAKRRKRQWQKD